MRYWFDTEFIEDGRTIELLSIGIVAEDGREFYREVWPAPLGKASEWVQKNVLPHLVHWKHGAHISWDDFPSCPGASRQSIALGIQDFVDPSKYGKPEFWAYYADYDWIVLCQLFGTMMDLPEGFPKYCLDIKQLCVDLGDPRLPEQGKNEHHALADAKWNLQAWLYLMRLRGDIN